MEPIGKAIGIGIVHFFLQASAPLLFLTVYTLAFKCIKKFKKIVYLFRFSSYKQIKTYKGAIYHEKTLSVLLTLIMLAGMLAVGTVSASAAVKTTDTAFTDNYVLLDYIVNTNGQYINTGYKAGKM